MKTLLKWILAGIAFAFGVMAAEHCDAFTMRQIRSLNAVSAATNGASFDGSTAAQMPPPGGGIQWNVHLTGAGFNTGTAINVQVQVKMTDGTWVPIAPGELSGTTNSPTIAITATGFPTNGGQVFTFLGPFIDMRVVVLSPYTGPGTVTADISVMY